MINKDELMRLAHVHKSTCSDDFLRIVFPGEERTEYHEKKFIMFKKDFTNFVLNCDDTRLRLVCDLFNSFPFSASMKY